LFRVRPRGDDPLAAPCSGSGPGNSGAQIEIWQCDANGHCDHPGDGGRANRDILWRNLRDEADRNALTVAFMPGSEGLIARFPIVVQA